MALPLVLLLSPPAASLCCFVLGRVCLAVLPGMLLVCPCCPLLGGRCERPARGPVEDEVFGVVGCGCCWRLGWRCVPELGAKVLEGRVGGRFRRALRGALLWGVP